LLTYLDLFIGSMLDTLYTYAHLVKSQEVDEYGREATSGSPSEKR